MQNLYKFDDSTNEIIDPPYNLFESYRIAIYVQRYDNAKKERVKTRTVVQLQGYLLTALCYKKGIDKTQVPKAIQALIDLETIDGMGRITNQVEMLIVDAIM